MAVLQSVIFKFRSYCRFTKIASLRFSTTTSLKKKSLEEKLGLEPKPKKPITPFLRFIINIRPELVQQQPSVKPTEVMKIAAERWKNVDDKIKNDLKKEYEEDLLKYQKDIKEYDAKLSPGDRDQILLEKENLKLQKEKQQLKKRRELLGCPKKPPTSFLLFLRSKASERGDFSHQEWISKMSKEWHSFTEEGKKPYIEANKKELEEYKKRLSKWEKDMVSQGMGTVLKQSQ